MQKKRILLPFAAVRNPSLWLQRPPHCPLFHHLQRRFCNPSSFLFATTLFLTSLSCQKERKRREEEVRKQHCRDAIPPQICKSHVMHCTVPLSLVCARSHQLWKQGAQTRRSWGSNDDTIPICSEPRSPGSTNPPTRRGVRVYFSHSYTDIPYPTPSLRSAFSVRDAREGNDRTQRAT